MIDEVIDLCGRRRSSQPRRSGTTNAPVDRALNTRAAGAPYDRIKIARVIRDLYLTTLGRPAVHVRTSAAHRCRRWLAHRRLSSPALGRSCVAHQRGLRPPAIRRPNRTTADYTKAQDAGGHDRADRRRMKDRHKPIEHAQGLTMAKQRISFVPLDRWTRRCARDGALPAVRRARSSAVRTHVPAYFWFFATLARHFPQRGPRPRHQTLPALRVALGAVRVLR